MLFNSFAFIFAFLPAVTFGYWLLLRGGGQRWSILALLIASYGFYLLGEHRDPWLLGGSILFNYGFGHLIARAEQPARRRLLAVGLAGDLLLLGYFKYRFFMLDQLLWLSGHAPLRHASALPIGISFYSFTQIAFLVDIYRRETKPGDLISYALFVSFYPHLIAGPILHNREMLPQFERRPIRNTADDLYFGLALFALGLAKKTLLADPIGSVADGIFGAAAAGGTPSFFIAWIGAIAYALQIYFDFSGYSDMAIGASRMIGIDLPLNFNSPYKSSSIAEFWRRWHITLSRFLRDYIYIPLGGNRVSPARRHANVIATMLLGGFWHGAGWTFILWGFIHGLAQCIAQLWARMRTHLGWPALPTPMGWALTILIVIFAWVPFRAPSIEVMLAMWRAMFGGTGFAVPSLRLLAPLAARLGMLPVDFGTGDLELIMVAAFIALAAPNSQQILGRAMLGLDTPGYQARGKASRIQLGRNYRSAIIVALAFGLALRAVTSSQSFIYFRF